jgi:hypothetical protein
VFDNGSPVAGKCPHDVLDYVKVDHYRTDLICPRCGETVGWLEDLEQDPQLYIAGPVRKLTEEELKELA